MAQHKPHTFDSRRSLSGSRFCNLPFSLLTVEVAFSIGETLGTMSKPKDITEMKRGSFMRVQVAVDIMKPLCRGQKVILDHDGEGWGSFMYEHLPNICH